ncbi:MAG: hypothetical protein AAGE43_16725, partial [Pseudomonadota bacterium]
MRTLNDDKRASHYFFNRHRSIELHLDAFAQRPLRYDTNFAGAVIGVGQHQVSLPSWVIFSNSFCVNNPDSKMVTIAWIKPAKTLRKKYLTPWGNNKI